MGTSPSRTWCPANPRVRYIRLERRLVLGAKRNLACEQARGDVIVHWDDDDWSASWRLRYQVEQFAAAGADIGGLDRVLFHDPAANEAWEYEYPRTAAPWVYGATLIYAKAFWRRNPFAPLSVGEDSRFVWAHVPKRVVPHDDRRFFVATVHTANTSRKDTRGHRWRRCSVEMVQRPDAAGRGGRRDDQAAGAGLGRARHRRHPARHAAHSRVRAPGV
jgi:hypothetical protein